MYLKFFFCHYFHWIATLYQEPFQTPLEEDKFSAQLWLWRQFCSCNIAVLVPPPPETPAGDFLSN